MNKFLLILLILSFSLRERKYELCKTFQKLKMGILYYFILLRNLITSLLILIIPILLGWYLLWNLYLYKFELIRDLVESIKNSLKRKKLIELERKIN